MRHKDAFVGALIGLMFSACTPGERAIADADAKAAEKIALSVAQEFCTSKALEAAVESLIPMSPEVESGLMLVCGIDRALAAAVHAKVSARAKDAGY